MVYKGHREITTIDVPYFLLYRYGQKKSKDGLRDIARAARRNRDARITRLPRKMLQHRFHMCMLLAVFILAVSYKGVPYKTENIIQQCLVNDLQDERCFGA